MLLILRTLLGNFGLKSCPVFEMDRATVELRRLPNNPTWVDTTNVRPSLSYRGISLAHAVVKADFLQYRNPMLPGLGFLLQSYHILDWAHPALSLATGGTNLLSDFVKTSLIGRIGQGFAILFANSRTMPFQCHLAEYLTTHNVPSQSEKVADFVCGAQGSALVIVESKASTACETNEPSVVKGLLKAALTQQVTPWVNRLSPNVSKGFVVGTFLRERTHNADPSCIVFVDPEGDGDDGDIPIRPDSVCRENYAAWLSAMGLREAADRLRTGSMEGAAKLSFWTAKIRNRRIAFPMILPFDLYISYPFHCHYGVMAGIDCHILSILSKAQGGTTSVLDTIPIQESVEVENEEYQYSIFPDGTFFGSVPLTAWDQIIEEIL